MSVNYLSCDVEERPFLFLDSLEMYRFVYIRPCSSYKTRGLFVSSFFLPPQFSYIELRCVVYTFFRENCC